jgi:hypothetical protein
MVGTIKKRNLRNRSDEVLLSPPGATFLVQEPSPIRARTCRANEGAGSFGSLGDRPAGQSGSACACRTKDGRTPYPRAGQVGWRPVCAGGQWSVVAQLSKAQRTAEEMASLLTLGRRPIHAAAGSAPTRASKSSRPAETSIYVEVVRAPHQVFAEAGGRRH